LRAGLPAKGNENPAHQTGFFLMESFTAIALSGGIDSLVAAALLKGQGRRLIGLHFLSGYEAGTGPVGPDRPEPNFAAIEAHARRAMEPLAEQLDIPLYIIDLRAEFQSRVVDYFVETYTRGKTPNPCLVCNPSIKFDILLKKARALGASRIATGHYARIETAGDGRKRLLRGTDRKKEQSYFLARLAQWQLACTVLPLGTMSKEQTRHIAHRKGLIPASARKARMCASSGTATMPSSWFKDQGLRPGPAPLRMSTAGSLASMPVCTASPSASVAASTARRPRPIMSCASTGNATA
jgi:tRNA-uridine 2-sulfurtransferase